MLCTHLDRSDGENYQIEYCSVTDNHVYGGICN